MAQIERLDSGRSSYVRYPDVRCVPVCVDAPSRSQLLNPIVFLLVDPPPRPGFIDLFSNKVLSMLLVCMLISLIRSWFIG